MTKTIKIGSFEHEREKTTEKAKMGGGSDVIQFLKIISFIYSI